MANHGGHKDENGFQGKIKIMSCHFRYKRPSRKTAKRQLAGHQDDHFDNHLDFHVESYPDNCHGDRLDGFVTVLLDDSIATSPDRYRRDVC